VKKSAFHYSTIFVSVVVGLGILTAIPASADRSPHLSPLTFSTCKPAPSPAILVALPNLNALAFVDTATQEVEQIDSVPGNPRDLLMHPRRALAFISVNNNTEIEYFDLLCQKSIAVISFPTAFSGMQVSDDGMELFVLDGTRSNLLVISVRTQRVIQTYVLPSQGLGFAYSKKAHELFVAEPSVNKIGVIDTHTGTTDQPISPSGCHRPIHGCTPLGIQAPAAGQYLFVTDGAGGIAIFNAVTHLQLVNFGGGSGGVSSLGGFDQALNGVSSFFNGRRETTVGVSSTVS